MRIVHVIPAVAARYGGPSRAVFGMCAALEAEGVRTMIATTDADGRGRLRVPTRDTVRFHDIDTVFFRRQWSEGVKFSTGLAGWLRRHTASFDVVHIHAVFSHSSIAAAREARRQHVPYVVRPLGSLSPWAMAQKRMRKRLFWLLAVKRMLHGAAAIHYTTEPEREQAEQALGIGRGVVIPLGVERAGDAPSTSGAHFRSRYPTVGAHPYVLFLGRLAPVKAVDVLLDAFLDAIAAGGGDAWRLVIGGDGDPAYRERLHALVRLRDAEARVVFTGWLEGDDKAGALAGAAVLAQPSHQESFGQSVVEAMAAGVPVIVPAAVDLASVVEAAGAGWVVTPGAGRLQRALETAMASEAERARRGRAGRGVATARFSWGGAARQLKALYAQLGTARHGRAS